MTGPALGHAAHDSCFEEQAGDVFEHACCGKGGCKDDKLPSTCTRSCAAVFSPFYEACSRLWTNTADEASMKAFATKCKAVEGKAIDLSTKQQAISSSLCYGTEGPHLANDGDMSDAAYAQKCLELDRGVPRNAIYLSCSGCG